MIENQEYTASLVHGRRSRLAEGARLRTLCRCQTVAELVRELQRGTGAEVSTEFERDLVQALAVEMLELAGQLPGPVAELLRWSAGRFQVEEIKLLVRRLSTGAPAEKLTPHLLSPRVDLGLDVEALAQADSLGALVRLLPRGSLRRALVKAAEGHSDGRPAFFFESALDQAHLAGLVAKAEAIPGDEGDWIRPVIIQEADIFHLLLVTRGKLIYGLPPEELRRFRVAGTRLARFRFEELLTAPDLSAVAGQVGRAVLGEAGEASGTASSSNTVDAAALERCAWSRLWSLANRTFRRSHMGPATVVAYTVLRRIEVANLVTICEGIRAGVPAEKIHLRLLPIAAGEVDRV